MPSIVIYFVLGICFHLIKGEYSQEAQDQQEETTNPCVTVAVPEDELEQARSVSQRLNKFLDINLENGYESMTEVLRDFKFSGDKNYVQDFETPLESILLRYMFILHKEMKQEIIQIKTEFTKMRELEVNAINHQIQEIKNIIPSIRDDMKEVIHKLSETIPEKIKEGIQEIKETIPPKQDISDIKEKIQTLEKNILQKEDFSDIREKIQTIAEAIPEKKDITDMKNEIQKIKEIIPQKEDLSDMKEKIQTIAEAIPEKKDITDMKNEIQKIKEIIPQKEDLSDIKEKIQTIAEAIPKKKDITDMKNEIQTIKEFIPQKEDLSDIKENIQTIIEAISEKKNIIDVENEKKETFPGKKDINGIKGDYKKSFDCCDLLLDGANVSGVYPIYPRNPDNPPVDVFCDMETEGGGWTVFLARMKQDEQINFTRNWEDYKNGFGSPVGEYWLGNDNLHLLTSNRDYTMRMEADDVKGKEIWGEWGTFVVASEDSKYNLTLTKFNLRSTSEDTLVYHNGNYFSTWDEDNDRSEEWDCAYMYKGGWWYRECYTINPTGIFGKKYDSGILFYYWSGGNLKSEYAERVHLKLRPKTCKSPFSDLQLISKDEIWNFV